MHAESNRTVQEVQRLSQEWAWAELRGDSAFFDRTFTGDFIGLEPFGFMLTKPKWLARCASGGLHYHTFALVEMRIRAHEDAAIVTARQTQTGTHQRSPLPGGGRATLV